MSDTVLNIEIDQNGLDFFNNTKEQIVIIRPFAINIALKVVCACFSPFPGKNEITFTDKWSLYASAQTIKKMAEIKAGRTQKNIALGTTYIFNNSGFNGLDSRHLVNSYGFSNKRAGSPFTTCGLIQDIIGVDNVTISAITCANETQLNQVTYFKPDSIIWIFIAKNIKPNMVIPSSTLAPNYNKASFTSLGTYLAIDLKSDTTIHFNSKTNLFEEGSLPQKNKQ